MLFHLRFVGKNHITRLTSETSRWYNHLRLCLHWVLRLLLLRHGLHDLLIYGCRFLTGRSILRFLLLHHGFHCWLIHGDCLLTNWNLPRDLLIHLRLLGRLLHVCSELTCRNLFLLLLSSILGSFTSFCGLIVALILIGLPILKLSTFLYFFFVCLRL